MLDVNNSSLQMSGVSGLQMFFGWVRTFVAHFLGKRNLEVYTAHLASANINNRPQIKVLAVNSEQYRVPSWGEFEKVIRDALLDISEEDKGDIIEALRNKIITGKGLAPDADRSLFFLREIIENRHKETCNLIMHCEAVVAALLESQKDDNLILAELSKVLGHVPKCRIFHSCLLRTWPTIWFRFQNYAALFVGNFSKFSGLKI
jgi:hypothetical protein